MNLTALGKSFTVLGIDQSLSGTGLAVIKADFPTVRVDRSTTVRSKLTGHHRLVTIINAVKAVVEESKPDLIVMEDVTRMAASASLSALVELAGIIRWELANMGRSALVQNQSSMKKFSFGNGSTQKDSGYMLKVLDSTGERFDSDDEADGYLHARLRAEIVWVGRGERKLEDLKKYQQETLLSPAKKLSKLTDSKFEKLSDTEKFTWFKQAYGLL
jgi:Holliday junction resolvasome RuvABC endonuclease subunit